ncbi:MAG: 30S ribosomal protein S20 [Bavariicoccus seileri]|uniref:Small ribosomal subunit protein bS20 n=1 Tax=Bavariicoccus seileri TaxID=549685 RepID=A0A3D4S3Q3_9ENTE|nr:30S ribosomal protein S20 [Bavariicoccus seileri]HCS93464.1 30S ribosomal protein S20 [Bavariicoccus seileri]
MPNIASAIKRVKTNGKSNLRNNAQKSALRNSVKRFETAVANGEENTVELLKEAQKAIDSAASKGLIHKNKANRDKARLASKLK